MSKGQKPPRQLELFAGRVSSGEAAAASSALKTDVHSLGLLGWKDPLWTTRFEITLLDGTQVPMTLLAIRQLHVIARSEQLSKFLP